MREPDSRSAADPVARRRTRQLAEILDLLNDIPDGRAGALVAEHLREFPADAAQLHDAMEAMHSRLIDQPEPPQLA